MSYKLKYLKYKTKYLKLKNMYGGDFTNIIKELCETYDVVLTENEINGLKAKYKQNKQITTDELLTILFSFRDIQKAPSMLPSLTSPKPVQTSTRHLLKHDLPNSKDEHLPSLINKGKQSSKEQRITLSSLSNKGKQSSKEQPITLPSLSNKGKQSSNSKEKQLSHSQEEGSLLSSHEKLVPEKDTSSMAPRNISKETVTTIYNNGQYSSKGTTYENTCMYLSIIYALKFLGIVNEVAVEDLRLLGGLNPIPDNQEWDYANEADKITLKAICRKYYISIDIYTLCEYKGKQFYYHALTITPPKQGHTEPTPVRIAHMFVHFEVITNMPGYNIKHIPKRELIDGIPRVTIQHTRQAAELQTPPIYEDIFPTPRNTFKQAFYNAIVDNVFLTSDQKTYRSIKDKIVNTMYHISKLKEELESLAHILDDSKIYTYEYTKEHIIYVRSEIKRLKNDIIQFETSLHKYKQEEIDFLRRVS